MRGSKYFDRINKTRNGSENNFLFFQPKLSINQPNDEYEREADVVADQVMQLNIGNENSFFKPATQFVQPTGNSSSGVAAKGVTESYLNEIDTEGSSLPSSVKNFFEPRFGHDFSDVKIHNDAEAHKSARDVNALAYTYGNHIVFGENQFSPQSENGKKLLAHELTHVVQQNHALASSIQRAAFVCDEYRTIATTNYNPGPGISLSLSGHAITIRANIELYGAGANSTIAGQLKSTIERIWNASFDDGYSVNTVVNISVQGATPDSSRTRIDVRNERGVSNVAPSYWIVGADYMQYYTLSSDINWTPAHEFGHLLGLPDHYSESIVSSIGGLIDPDWRTSTEDQGWEGNLMARNGGPLEKKNLEELIRIGFRPRRECARGHVESPL